MDEEGGRERRGRREGSDVGMRNRYHLSFWRFAPCFIAIFGPIGGNPCSEANCGVVTFFFGTSGGFGVLEP